MHAFLCRQFDQQNHKLTDYLKGDLAEVYHTETFNIDVAAKSGENVEAVYPRTTNGPDQSVDVRVHHNNDQFDYQLKYYKSGEDTAKAISNPKYKNLGNIGQPLLEYNLDYKYK